ncbi:MAG: uracil phosphoribosyltransferase, partial [bacterium]|nr:uracil phosphoribosyltransferase [bacterium]
LKPVWYYNKVPMPVNNPDHYYVFITDPMLATGNSLREAIRLYVEKGIPQKNICCVCMISAPEGIESVFGEFPDIKLLVTAVDSHLNEHGYIVPGMGDAGDRIYNTL